MGVKSTLAAMTLKAKVVIVCAAVAVTGTAAGIGIAMTREEAYRVLKVFELTGSATVERDGSGELDAYTGMNLESGDTLTVGDESTIRISLDDDKYILLDSGTILELNASGTAADSRTSIDLKQGSILNEITNPLSEKSSYEVATPKATMAVRGTSFIVSVEEDDDGVYMINENTLQGKVEIELIDNKGNRTGKKAFTPAGGGVMICTEPNENSGNPAEIDGTSKFVIPNGEGGGFYIVNDGEDPTFDINYDSISSAIKNRALRSNDEDVMPLNNEVLENLRDTEPQTESSVTTTVTTTQTTTTAVTTVPETAETEEETTITAAPITTVTTVPETDAYVPQTKPTTTAQTTVPTTKQTEKSTKKTTHKNTEKNTEKTTGSTKTQETSESTTTTASEASEAPEETTVTGHTHVTTSISVSPIPIPAEPTGPIITSGTTEKEYPTEYPTDYPTDYPTTDPTYPPTDPGLT